MSNKRAQQQQQQQHQQHSNPTQATAFGSTEPQEEPDEHNSVVLCACTQTVDAGAMIQCERCLTWQHGDCLGIDIDSAEDYRCFRCSPDKYIFNNGASKPAEPFAPVPVQICGLHSRPMTAPRLYTIRSGMFYDLSCLQKVLQSTAVSLGVLSREFKNESSSNDNHSSKRMRMDQSYSSKTNSVQSPLPTATATVTATTAASVSFSSSSSSSSSFTTSISKETTEESVGGSGGGGGGEEDDDGEVFGNLTLPTSVVADDSTLMMVSSGLQVKGEGASEHDKETMDTDDDSEQIVDVSSSVLLAIRRIERQQKAVRAHFARVERELKTIKGHNYKIESTSAVAHLYKSYTSDSHKLVSAQRL